MQDFTEPIKEAYELYSQGKVKQALSQLRPGSKYYEYIRIMEALKADTQKLTKEAKDLISEYRRLNSNNLQEEVFQSVVDTLSRRGEYEFLKELGQSTLGIHFDHQKPYYIQNSRKKDDENLGPNHWEQSAHFDYKAEIEKVYSSDYAINNLHKSLWNEVDYNRLSDYTLENVLNTLDTTAILVTKTFIERFATYVKAKFDDPHNGYYYSIPSHYLVKLSLEQLDTLKAKCSRAGEDMNFKCSYFKKTYHYYFEDPEFYE